jgi:polyketide biosynthesis enoyl-CoA hydratase PksH
MTLQYAEQVYQTLRLRTQPGVCFVQLYRPEAQNALNEILVQELGAALRAIEEDPNVRVVVLQGLPQVFSSGMDFQEFVETAPGEEHRMRHAGTLFQQLADMSKIIVAQVRGQVIGGGMALVAVSDLVVADTAATFALSELLFGLLPALVLPLLIQRVGFARAKLLALSTQPITADEAHRWGLVDHYGDDPDRLLRPYLQRWRRLSTPAIQTLKNYTRRLAPVDEATQNLALPTIIQAMSDPEIKAGIKHYLEEGVPPWSR